MTVFAQLTIEKGTIFGPLGGIHVHRSDDVPNFRFAVESKGGWQRINLTSDRHCNWMKWVRMDANPETKNLAAFQQNGQVFFYSTKQISLGDELVVWYNNAYEKELVNSGLFLKWPLHVVSWSDGSEYILKQTSVPSEPHEDIPNFHNCDSVGPDSHLSSDG